MTCLQGFPLSARTKSSLSHFLNAAQSTTRAQKTCRCCIRVFEFLSCNQVTHKSVTESNRARCEVSLIRNIRRSTLCFCWLHNAADRKHLTKLINFWWNFWDQRCSNHFRIWISKVKPLMSNKDNGTFCAWPPESRQHNQPNWQTNKGEVGRRSFLPYLPGCDVLFCTCLQREEWIAQQFYGRRGWSKLNRCVESKKCNMSQAAISWPRLKTVYTTNRARSTFYHQAKHVCVSECVYPWGGKLQRETRGQRQ